MTCLLHSRWPLWRWLGSILKLFEESSLCLTRPSKDLMVPLLINLWCAHMHEEFEPTSRYYYRSVTLGMYEYHCCRHASSLPIEGHKVNESAHIYYIRSRIYKVKLTTHFAEQFRKRQKWPVRYLCLSSLHSFESITTYWKSIRNQLGIPNHFNLKPYVSGQPT